MAPRLDLPIAEMELKYKDGASFRDLAKEYNCSNKAIRDRFKEYGIRSRPNIRVIPESEIVNLYLGGESILSLADKYNCSPCVIRSRLVENKIEIRSQRYYMLGKQYSLGYKHDEEFCRRSRENAKKQKWSVASREKMSVTMKPGGSNPDIAKHTRARIVL